MKYKWINKQNNNNLIMFFNGWGMDEEVVKHLDSALYDVVMFYDYNSLVTDFDFSVQQGYDNINIISWSMGVMIGSIFASKINRIDSSSAINGTLKPIDAKFGINPRIYDLTIKGFDSNGRAKFVANMFDKPVDIKLNRTLENQKSELSALKNYTASDFQYTKILISDDDKIIPTKSQCEFWGIKPNVSGGHCPFFLFNSWSELL